MTDDTASHLDNNQLARAEALDRARRVLTSRGFAREDGPSDMELINVATWIITGCNPWDSDADVDKHLQNVRALRATLDECFPGLFPTTITIHGGVDQ